MVFVHLRLAFGMKQAKMDVYIEEYDGRIAAAKKK
jgi:hypothetical protein